MTIHQTTIRPAVTPAEQRYLDLYASVADKLPGAGLPAVRASREAALDAFTLLGVPHRRVEEWKYTDLRALMPEVHPLGGLDEAAAADVSIEAAAGKSLAHLDAYRIVFVNGRFRGDLSTIKDVAGVTFEPLRQILVEGGAPAEAAAKLPLRQRDVTAALSTAFATDGCILSVAPKTALAKPIHLIVISSGEKPHLFALQHAVSIGEGAEVSLIETHAGAGKSQALALTRLAIGAHASLKHVRLAAGHASKHLASSAVSIGEGARYEPLQVAMGGALVRAEAAIRFEGPDARCHYGGAMLLREHAHADFTLVVEHAAPHCESRELVKAVLDGRSRILFAGCVQ